MIKSFKNKFVLILMLLFTIFVVGCGGTTPGGQTKKEFKEENYTMGATYVFEKNLTVEEVKAAIDTANAYFAEAKSYSYTTTMKGNYDSEYNYSGITKIDVTGETPKASVELNGTSTYGFYIADNKVYTNYDGFKTCYEIETNINDFVNSIQEEIGGFKSFSSADITAENLQFAGIDKDDATVIQYTISDGTNAVIVIHNNKIMKVLYKNIDSQECVMTYDYNAVTIELPSDLDSYEKLN